MDSKDFFEHFYHHKKDFSYSKSLYTFFDELVRPRILIDNPNVLDIGAGSYSIFEDCLNFKCKATAIDFSKEAIEHSPKSNIIYKEANLVDSKFFEESTYDLIFDSHCMNCIVEEEERLIAFNNIYRGLKIDGLFASELMVSPSGKYVSMPFKKIKSALELEQEIISNGFKILYFTISSENKFQMDVDGIEVQCDVLRIIGQKKARN